jgi:hypothetical protein
MRIGNIIGQVFRDPYGKEFGRIRAISGVVPAELEESSFSVFAEDECGNFFVKNADAIGFWDHETSRITLLANSESAFMAGIAPATKTNLRPGHVKSAWLDPAFAELLRKAPHEPSES